MLFTIFVEIVHCAREMQEISVRFADKSVGNEC